MNCFWRFVDGEASIARIVAMVDDDEYDELMKKSRHAQNQVWQLLRPGACGTAGRPWESVLGTGESMFIKLKGDCSD